MISTLKKIIYIKAAIWVNTFIFYFRRLWVIGELLPDSLYSNYPLKRILSVVAVIIRQIIDISGKPIYLLFVVMLPISGNLIGKGYEFETMVQILFFLNCMIGSFGDSQLFTVTRDKITCIKYMHMDTRSYVLSSLAFKYIPFFVYYLPFLILFSNLLGGTALQGFFLWLVFISFRLMGEAFQLFIFDKTEKVYFRNVLIEWIIILFAIAGAYVPPALGWYWPIADILLHPMIVLLLLAFGGFCLYYIVGYPGYEKKFQRSIDINYLLSSVMKTAKGSTFTEVEIKEKDLNITETTKEQLNKRKGYSYMNALFFARHRRQLVKPVYYRLLATVAIFIGGVALFYFKKETAIKISQNITAMLPSFVFIMYFMTVADKASRAMFYNCDKNLLRYSFYRQPKTILQNFKIRLYRVSLYDLAVGAAVCLAVIAFCLLCGTNVLTVDMLLFCVAILLLSILFTAHHLCMYYIFQPYSESLSVKNPFFSIINAIMYTLCFLCLQLEVGGFAFTMMVLVFTITYIGAVLAFVYRISPKSFRVK
jgi:hypothetical protein